MPDKNPLAVFYVYILFDECAIPRYVGKGKGKRIISTLRQNPKTANRLKKDFIDQTRAALGEIPAVKVRENLTEAEALEIEMAFIAAIGRRKTGDGPLTNLSAGGDGFTTESAKALHDSRSPEQKKAVHAAISAAHLKHSPEERRDRALRRQHELGADRRKESAQKGAATRMLIFTPEERIAAATRASLSVSSVFWINDGTTNQRIGPDDSIPMGWVRGRLNSNTDAVKISCIESRWINNGEKTKRLKPNQPLPHGWVYGRCYHTRARSNADHCSSTAESST